MTGKDVINGTYGEVWMDNEKIAECYGLQAKIASTKEDVSICGQLAVDSKVVSIKYTGSLKMHKVNSRMAMKVGDKLKAGLDPRFVIMSKLADPDSRGAEKVALKNVSFDDVTLADWEAAKKGSIEAPFTCTDHEFLDKIEV